MKCVSSIAAFFTFREQGISCNNFLETRELLSYNREQGNIDFLTTGKTFLMCKREKGLSDAKILAKYYDFSHFSVIKEEKEAFRRGVPVLWLTRKNLWK